MDFRWLRWFWIIEDASPIEGDRTVEQIFAEIERRALAEAMDVGSDRPGYMWMYGLPVAHWLWMPVFQKASHGSVWIDADAEGSRLLHYRFDFGWNSCIAAPFMALFSCTLAYPWFGLSVGGAIFALSFFLLVLTANRMVRLARMQVFFHHVSGYARL